MAPRKACLVLLNVQGRGSTLRQGIKKHLPYQAQWCIPLTPALDRQICEFKANLPTQRVLGWTGLHREIISKNGPER